MKIFIVPALSVLAGFALYAVIAATALSVIGLRF